MHARTLVAATAAGAAAMYWLDPQNGRRRRAQSRQRALHLTHQAEHAAGVLARDLAHRREGLRGALGRSLRPGPVSDEVLTRRVRARLGRLCSHPHAVEVASRDGQVTVQGPILAEERARVVHGVARVAGVKSVVDQLAPHADPAHVSALQGGRSRPVPTVGLLQGTWPPATRALAAVTGLLLLASGRRHGPLLASVARTATGAALLARAAGTRGRAHYTVLGGRPAVTVRKTIHVRRPVDDVFALWGQPEAFPRFMTHVQVVRRDDRRSYWKVTGPLGASFEWGAEVTDVQPNRRIAWRSLEGSDIEHAGTITFTPHGDLMTEIQIQLSYRPPGGVVGHALATLLGAGPKKQLDDDLLRLKSLLETGKATGLGAAVTREEVV